MSFEKQISKIKSCQQKLQQLKSSSHAIILYSKDEKYLESFANLTILNDVCQFSKKPCFECANCQKVINGNAIDVEVFGTEKNILVADSNKIIADSFVVPLEFEKKYFVLKNFDRATEQAQNKLLKVIEEPQKFDKFVLLTTNQHSILPTIKSRTEIHQLPLLTNDDLLEILKDELFEKEKLIKSIKLSSGNLTKCLKILNDEEYFEMFDLAEKLVAFLTNSSKMLDFSSEIAKFYDKIDDFFDILQDIYLNLLNIKSGIFDLENSKLNQYKIISGDYSQIAIIKIMEQINLAKSKAKIKISTAEIVDNLLLKILEIKHICK